MAKRFHWRKQKALAVLANRRQFDEAFNPLVTSALEILMEHSDDYNFLYLSDESRVDPQNNSIPTNIIAEHQ